MIRRGRKSFSSGIKQATILRTSFGWQSRHQVAGRRKGEPTCAKASVDEEGEGEKIRKG